MMARKQQNDQARRGTGNGRTSARDATRRNSPTARVAGPSQVPGDQVATKQDIAEVRGEIAGVKGEVAEVRGEIAGVKGEVAGVKGEIAGVRLEIATSISKSESKMGDRMDKMSDRIDRLSEQMNGTAWRMLAGNLALMSLFFMVIKFHL